MAKRERVARIVLTDDNGEVVNSPEDARAVRFEFFKPGSREEIVETRVVPINEFDEDTRRGLQALGLKAYLAESYTARQEKGQYAWALFDERLEQLRNGEWITRRSGTAGPGKTILVEAVQRVAAASGKEVDMAKLANVIKSEEGRKALLAQPLIKAEYEKVKAERAAARAKAAAKEAKGSEFDLSAIGL